MYLGVLVGMGGDIDERIGRVRAFGLSSCQICNWDQSLYTDERAADAARALKRHGVSVSTFWAGYSGPAVWDLVQGPLTLGLLPEQHRAHRVEELKRGGDFAARLGISQVATHVGFIPENPNEAAYAGMIEALRQVAAHLAGNGQTLLFETGQETPVTMLRAFEDIGLSNLGVNLDPANLLLYGKGNPVDALDVIGRYVRDVHAKDGTYPTTGRALGQETPLGEGAVDFPRLVARLRALGYDGALTIEREIEGEEQQRDIRRAIELLTPLL